jgi:SAM-dependent methyltransferase
VAELSAHARRNREFWNAHSGAYQELHRDQLARGAAWGVWQIPESELGILGDVNGLDVLELGCGAAQWSIALAGMGARMVGLDLSAKQLEHAREAQAAAGVEFPLVESSAEAVPLEDASFDVVFCDHGAFNFADPARLVPEAARLLRPGGLLAFSMVSPILDTCWELDADEARTELRNNYFELGKIDDGETISFQLPYGGWIRLFRANGFDLEDLVELRPPEGATTSYETVSCEWARRWPAENIWKARRRAG